MVPVDLLTRSAVVQGLAELAADPDYCDHIFRGLPDADLDEIKAYVATAAITMRLGWTQQAVVMPCIAIVVPAENEDQQYVGSQVGRTYDAADETWNDAEVVEDGFLHAWRIASFAGAVDCAIYCENATETAWLGWIVKWIMLRYRPTLEGGGMEQQRVSLTDFMPASDYPQPDPAYTRVVKTSYVALSAYTLPPVAVAVAATVAVDPTLTAFAET